MSVKSVRRYADRLEWTERGNEESGCWQDDGHPRRNVRYEDADRYDERDDEQKLRCGYRWRIIWGWIYGVREGSCSVKEEKC